MNQLRETIKTHFELLNMTGCLLLVIGIFFSPELKYGMGIFGVVGNIFFPLLEKEAIVSQGMDYLQGITDDYIPTIYYNRGSFRQGDSVEFKSMISVKKQDGTIVNGSMEDGFALYLVDIRTTAGNSVLEKMSTDTLANLEEIPATFVYDKEMDMLYIFGSGNFTVFVKIYSDTGSAETYEFQLPIEFL